MRWYIVQFQTGLSHWHWNGPALQSNSVSCPFPPEIPNLSSFVLDLFLISLTHNFCCFFQSCMLHFKRIQLFLETSNFAIGLLLFFQKSNISPLAQNIGFYRFVQGSVNFPESLNLGVEEQIYGLFKWLWLIPTLDSFFPRRILYLL